MPPNHLHNALLTAQPDDSPFVYPAGGNALTYGALRKSVARATGQLVRLGVGPSDRVLCQCEKNVSGLILYLATVAAGGVFVPLNTSYTAAEIGYFVEDAKPSLFIHDPSIQQVDEPVAALGIASTTPDSLLAPGSEASPARRAPNDLAAILYTSGTTGRPKGAMLTHDNLVSNAKALVETWQYRASDRLLHMLPIFHTHGLFVATNVTLAAGASLIFLPAFSLDAAARHLPKATTIMGVPTFYTRMLEDTRFGAEAFRHIRLVISGSAPLRAETHTAFQSRTGHAILERYGMTETNMIASNPVDGPRRAGTVGRPLPDVSVRLSTPDGQGIGEIEVCGPNVTPGYWRAPDKTAESVTADGWFRTGDLGTFDADGYLSIVGRQKDLVISGGYNIYPKEIEVELDRLPDIVESAVFGVPHSDMGEVVVAAIVRKSASDVDADAVLAALRERLAPYKLPRKIRFVDTLPRNTMGKVQKAELRRMENVLA